MSKKRASSPVSVSQSAKKAAAQRANGTSHEESDPGEFEDEWGDDYESESGEEEDAFGQEEDAEVQLANGKMESMELDGEDEGAETVQAYLPGLGQGSRLEEDEELVPDLSSYVLLHHARLAWPCLSFDILRDSEGAHRLRPPFNASVVAGTQADSSATDGNEVVVMRWENLTKSKDDDSEDSEDESDDEDEPATGKKDDATLVYRSIPHAGGVNRIRARLFRDLGDPPPEPPEPYHVATFADTGKVHIFDIAPHLQSLTSTSTPVASLAKKPQHTVTSHGRSEGFALAWGPPVGQASSSRLLSGDIAGKIFLTTLTPSAFTPSPQPFTSHTSSVEDIQWSPEELTVFASCSADQSVRIWDVRVKQKRSVLSLDKAHDADVNVLSWNTSTKYLLLTGGDEGGLKVWDLRQMKGSSAQPTPVAAFSWHQAPITSVEWHPTDDSAFLASSADDSVTQWDLAVEADDDDANAGFAVGDRAADVPAQLLFVHQGQEDVKEAHWHPQIPGMAVSTASNGFSVWKSISS